MTGRVAVGVGPDTPPTVRWRWPAPVPSYPRVVGGVTRWLAAHWPRATDLAVYLGSDVPPVVLCALATSVPTLQADRGPATATLWVPTRASRGWQPALVLRDRRWTPVAAAPTLAAPPACPPGVRGGTDQRFWPLVQTAPFPGGLLPADTPDAAWLAAAQAAVRAWWSHHPAGGLVLTGPTPAVVGAASLLPPTGGVRVVPRRFAGTPWPVLFATALDA